MKSKLIWATVLAFVAFSNTVAIAAAAAAGKQYILGVNLTFLSVKPTGETVVSRGVTDVNGRVDFTGLAPGNYVIQIDGSSLVAAMDKLVLPAPKNENHSSFSLGIGGFMGGGSGHRSSGREGAGPAGHESGGSHSSSGGGVGLGISVPIGGSDPHAGLRAPLWVWVAMMAHSSGRPNAGDAGSFSTETPYCRDTAGNGMRISFTVPAEPSTLTNEPRTYGIALGVHF